MCFTGEHPGKPRSCMSAVRRAYGKSAVPPPSTLHSTCFLCLEVRCPGLVGVDRRELNKLDSVHGSVTNEQRCSEQANLFQQTLISYTISQIRSRGSKLVVENLQGYSWICELVTTYKII